MMNMSEKKQEIANELDKVQQNLMQSQQIQFQLQQRLQQLVGQLQLLEELEKEKLQE